MGDQDGDRSAKVEEPRTMAVSDVVRTWWRDTGVSIGGDPLSRDATAKTERPPAPPPPPRFTVLRELGRGGMGRVDEVFDAVLGRPVAQKSVLPGAGMLETTLLVSEAQTCAQLEHPSIVPVYDFGPSAEGHPQYTMRRVLGRTLRQVLAETSPDALLATLAQRLGVLRQVCLAVAYAHTRGVVHRDLKPDNIICGEFGEVYVLDWGIAQLVEGSDVKRTKHDDVQAGSPGYMAPEQVLGDKIVTTTDVFALGAMLYEIVTGEQAFDDRDVVSIIRRCKTGLESPPSVRGPRVPRGFDPLVMRCLALDPAERPSARDVANAIDAFLDGERARVERELEADTFAAEGERARAAFDTHRDEAQRMRDEAEAALRQSPSWSSADEKQETWELAERADGVAKDAARALAHAQAAFVRALGRVPDHARARRGLASLHYRLFEAAEADGDANAMAQHLELARGYDDGELALELANEGVLIVEPSVDAIVSVARYCRSGRRLVLGDPRAIRPGTRTLLDAGSYVVVARPLGSEHAEASYPILIQRAQVHRLRLRIAGVGEVPRGLVFVSGGPFRAAADRNASHFVERSLPDFAIGRFPVTFREYAVFLDAMGGDVDRRVVTGEDALMARDPATGRWGLTPIAIEGEARARVPVEYELDIPAARVSWYDACAYVKWRSQVDGVAYRLPIELEWEKALRGADGRRFAMGDHLDPSFAKLRESRPEASQLELVGAFPSDESPHGVRDLTGGVGDWTSTMADGRPPATLDEEGTVADARQAIWRGGCWCTTGLTTQASDLLSTRNGWVGFRLALSLDSHGSSELTVEPMRRS
jgi:formylglycine-generating enzyme required for sulfatase activity